MKTRRLGKTNLQVSEIGFGGMLERHPKKESIELSAMLLSKGINILDLLDGNPKSKISLEKESKKTEAECIIQGHIGST